MGRTKQQERKKGGHSADAMKKAIELVQGGMSIRKFSKECQLSYPTVRFYVKRSNENVGQPIRLTPHYEVNKVFTSEEEYSFHSTIVFSQKLISCLAPSTVTDRPLIIPSNQAEEVPDQTRNTPPSSHLQENGSVNVDLQLTPPTIMAPDMKISFLGHEQADEPTPSTSKQFLSPMNFFPPIKAKPRVMKRRRIPGKSMIATDTPEKDAIAEKKKKENKKQIDKAKQDLFKGTMRKESIKNKKKAHVIEDSDTSDDEEFIASGSSSGGDEFISENEDDDGKIVLDDNFLPIPRDPKENELPDRILPDPKITGSNRRQTSFSFDVHFDMSLLSIRKMFRSILFHYVLLILKFKECKNYCYFLLNVLRLIMCN